MKLGRRPGAFTSFVDSFTEETILRIEASSTGEILLTFHLYDCHGALVQDAEAYQRLLDVAASSDAREGIRQGMEDTRKGRVRPVKEFFEEFEAKHGLPR